MPLTLAADHRPRPGERSRCASAYDSNGVRLSVPRGIVTGMCRNIRPLNNFEPPATTDEVRAAALQYVRKIGGASKPSQANQGAYDLAVERIATASQELLDSLVTTAPPKNREEEAAKAKARSAARFAS